MVLSQRRILINNILLPNKYNIKSGNEPDLPFGYSRAIGGGLMLARLKQSSHHNLSSGQSPVQPEEYRASPAKSQPGDNHKGTATNNHLGNTEAKNRQIQVVF